MDKSIVNEWLLYSENDFEAAKILSSYYPMKLEIICYHCQQAVEKALKAFLLYSDIEPPRTHNLTYLVDLCITISIDFNHIIDECEYLNPFGVQPKYPFGIDLIESDAIISINKCKKILEFIKNKTI